MANILEELWYRNIIPMEHTVEGNVHIKNLGALICKSRDSLAKSLTDTLKALLVKYDKAVNEMYSEIEKETFIYGFKLSGRLVYETFRNNI